MVINFTIVEEVGQVISKTFLFTCMSFDEYADEPYHQLGYQMEIVYDSQIWSASLFMVQKQNEKQWLHLLS